MFFGAKSIVWDREIDGEILINDTQIKDPKVGEIYDCLITDFHGDKLLGTIIEH